MSFAKMKKQANSNSVIMFVFLVAALLLASACATGGKYMTETERISAFKEGKALVTFLRPSKLGAAIPFHSISGTVMYS